MTFVIYLIISTLLNAAFTIPVIRYFLRLQKRTIASDQRLMTEIMVLRNDLIDAKEQLRILRRREAKSKYERNAEQIKIFDAVQKVKAEF